MVVMVETIDFFIKNLRKNVQFHAVDFYKVPKLMLWDLKELYRRRLSVEHACSQSSMAVKWPETQGRLRSVKSMFLNKAQQFGYGPLEKRKHCEESPDV